MKQLTIVLGKNESKFSINIEDEQASKVFYEMIIKLSSNAFESPSEIHNSIKRHMGDRIDITYALENKSVPAGIKIPIVGTGTLLPTSNSFGTGSPKPFDSERPSMSTERKSLIFLECPSCKSIIYRVGHIGSIDKCFCGEPLLLDNLVPGRYICECGYKSSFDVKNGTNLEEVKCKMCAAPIDMKYHEAKKEYLSLNLIK